MNVEAENAELKKLYDAANKKGLEIVEALAREFMEKHPEIQSFINAMGSWFYNFHETAAYYDETGEKWNLFGETCGSDKTETYDGLHLFYHKEMDDFMCEWDNVYNLTGESFRLDSDRISGEIVRTTDW